MPAPACRRDQARPVRAGDGLRVGGFVLVAIQLVLALGALATAAEAKQDRSYGGDRSSMEDRSDRHDRSFERDSSEAGDRSYGRSFSRGRSNEQRGWGNRRGSGDGRSGWNDRSRSDDRGRRDSDDQGEDDRGDSGNGNRRGWEDRDDDRSAVGGNNQSSRRAAAVDDDDQDASATPQSNETSVDSQSVAPTAPVAAPDSPAAPQTQAPADDSPSGDSQSGRRATGDGAGGRDDDSRRTRSGAGREGNRAGGAFAAPALAPLALLPTTASAAPAAAGGDAASRPDRGRDKATDGAASPVVRTVRDIVEIVPGWMKWAIAGLAALSLLLAGGYALSALRARRLARQRAELLGEVGLLQAALLPAVPEELTDIGATVAYAPADGPGAGGDFYDVLPLAEGRTGFVLGDLSGHGRKAIEHTAFMRYTLRAYLEAGLEPAAALHVAGRVIGDNLDGDDFATVLLAVHDPHDSSLTFAGAGHPPPIVVGGGASFEPILAGGSPPLGIGEPTGMRQTTVPLASRSVACLYTDGLSEARTADGVLGEERLEQIVVGLGPDATARQLLDAVAAEAVATPDDMATCLLSPKPDIRTGGFRSERLELSADELDGPLLERFLRQCDVPTEQRAEASAEAHEVARQSGGALVTVVFGSRRAVDVLPRNVTLLDAASRRAA